MAYATEAELRQYMDQIPDNSTTDALLTEILDRATSIINGFLGITFAAYPASATAKDVEAPGYGEYMTLPGYQAASITSVYAVYSKASTGETTEAITDYDILDDGRLYRGDGWPAAWYRVTAKWGWGPAPDALTEVCLQVASWLFKRRDAGFGSIGVEGNGGQNVRLLPWELRDMLNNLRRDAHGIVVA